MQRLGYIGLALAATVLALASRAPAQEKVTLSAPVFVDAGATDFRVASIYLKRDHPDGAAEIRVIFREVTGSGFVLHGRDLTCSYAGPDAETLLRQLNTMNLSTTSLEKRVTTRCQADNKLGAGTITGTPQ
ncbi:MAG TPA: hypothetical protein VN803_06835 [Gemmatimonadales bacterium]|nr:hypothetical protein [Gemmatimonadales bacterium]